jgi:hypothetical protein
MSKKNKNFVNIKKYGLKRTKIAIEILSLRRQVHYMAS